MSSKNVRARRKRDMESDEAKTKQARTDGISNPTSMLLRALKKVDCDAVKKCLSGIAADGTKMAKADPNYIDKSGGWSIAHFALPFTDTPNADSPNNAKNLQLVVQHGAKVDFYDDYGMTALHWAAARGSKFCLKVLCVVYKEYSDNHQADPKEEKVQEQEKADNSEEEIEDSDNDAEAKTNQVKREVLDMKRFRQNNADGLRSGLISGGGNLNINHIEANAEAKNALHFAALYGQTVALQLLIQHGADVEARTRELWTPLHFAAHAGFAKCVKVLLDAGASVYPTNDGGKTAMKMAISGAKGAKQDDFAAGADTDRPNCHQECIALLEAAEASQPSPKEDATPYVTKLPQPKETFYVWTVDKILDMRMVVVKPQNGQRKEKVPEYLTKWKGYSEVDSTWESLETLKNCKGLVKSFHQKLEEKNARSARKLYKPVTLESLLSPDRITSVQRLSKFASYIREYRLKLKPGSLDRPELSCRDREITPQIRAQIVKILKGEHTHEAFEIGMITDESNPACRFEGTTVHVGKSYGLYATRHIDVDTVLGEYVGVVNKYDDCQRNADLETELNQTTYFDLIESQKWGEGKGKCAIGETLVIDPSECRNELVYMNDYRSEEKDANRKQNVAYHEVLVNGWPHIYAITKREIPIAGELLTNYGQAWWENFRIIMRRQAHLAELKKKWTQEVEQTKLDNQNLRQEIESVREEMSYVLQENERLKKEQERLKKELASIVPKELR